MVLSTNDNWNNEDAKFNIETKIKGNKKYCKSLVVFFLTNTVNKKPVKQ